MLDGHIDMEAEARGRHEALLEALGIQPEETRQARPPTPFEIAGARVDSSDHRGVAGNVVEFDGDLGLVIGAGGGSLTLFDAAVSWVLARRPLSEAYCGGWVIRVRSRAPPIRCLSRTIYQRWPYIILISIESATVGSWSSSESMNLWTATR